MKKQSEISQELQVAPDFFKEKEIEKRITFIKAQLLNSKQINLVLGISGGIDSTLAGRLSQLAVEQLREEGYLAHFIALRLPYGQQKDESDAQTALQFIKPDKCLTINIKKACDESLDSIKECNFLFASPQQEDFILGNIKARQRMIVQYSIANASQGLVVGTDHAAEALMGFFTKFGDGACDFTPLSGLTKGRIKSIAHHLGAPLSLVNKIPTADLENLKPLLPDEEVYGISYQQIDDYLEGKKVPQRVQVLIEATYAKTQHKRHLPSTP
ncbi:MAG: ammonia-dependent NAD(+) synthetase [Tatlockia sp.]|nr:ammonia-dependent NAD(+) synthetase [Tatlockia sp.]